MEYLFIAEAPGKNELAQSEPMVGQAGFVLRNWLVRAVPTLQLAWDQGKVGLANVLRCLPPEVQGRAYPRGQEKADAERHCRQYDKWDGPKRVILFGENAQRLFFQTELEAEDASDKRIGRDVKGVMGRIGRVYEKNGVTYTFAPHPAWILRQPALVQHGQAALAIAAGEARLATVTYRDWNDAVQDLHTV